jgi:CRP-like cAMP-binding protein
VLIYVYRDTIGAGGVVFDEGDIGNHFYMILDGEVSIIKIHRTIDGEFKEAITLVKLYRGQSFGETALEHKGMD